MVEADFLYNVGKTEIDGDWSDTNREKAEFGNNSQESEQR